MGAFETLVGAIVLGGNDSALLGGLLAIGAGAVVGLVAGRGDRRRATTWIGVLAVFGGCVAVLVDIAPSSAAGVGGIAFGFALVLGSLAFWLAPVLGEPDDGFEPVPPPTAPPGGDVGDAARSPRPPPPDGDPRRRGAHTHTHPVPSDRIGDRFCGTRAESVAESARVSAESVIESVRRGIDALSVRSSGF